MKQGMWFVAWIVFVKVYALGGAEILSVKPPFFVDCEVLDRNDWYELGEVRMETIARELEIVIAWHLFCRGRSGRDAITFFEPITVIPWKKRTKQERLVLIKSYKIGRLAYDDPAVARTIEPYTFSKEVFFNWLLDQMYAGQKRAEIRDKIRRQLGLRCFVK